MDGLLDELKRDLERRLRPLMPHIREAEFQELIDRMARLQHKYEVKVANEVLGRSPEGGMPGELASNEDSGAAPPRPNGD